MFCVYLTIYLGEKLPTFYIGSTSLEKFQNGYRGSVWSKKYRKFWLSEPKHLFKTKLISIHNSRKEAFDKEEYFQRKLDVLNNNLYINQVIANKHFRHSDKLSDSHRKKISEAHKGKPGTRTGFKTTEETRAKMRKAAIGRKHTEETKQKLSRIVKEYRNSHA